jgi:hypothetical protein
MNHNETEIPIIGGYEGLEYTIDGGRKAQIPSQKLLEELIRFPKIDKRYPDTSDPFNLDYYRIRDRDEDLNNQLLLQSRSNWIIGKIDEQRFHPSEYEKAMFSFCDKYSLCAESIYYRLNLMKYCRNILPGGNVNPYKNSTLIRNFSRLDPIVNSLGDRSYDMEKTFSKDASINAYQKKQVLIWESIRRRFLEFNEAWSYMDYLSSSQLYHEHFLNIHHEDLLIQNRNNERTRKRRTKDRNGVRKNHNSNNQILDYRKTFSQCVFCNRFHLQEPARTLRRFCYRPECELKNKAWVESLTPSRKDIDITNVSPSGF